MVRPVIVSERQPLEEVDAPHRPSKCSTLMRSLASTVRMASKAAFVYLLYFNPTPANAIRMPGFNNPAVLAAAAIAGFGGFRGNGDNGRIIVLPPPHVPGPQFIAPPGFIPPKKK